MNGPNKLEIDLSALAHNLRQIRSQLDTGTAVMGIVKSDAYGHGLVPVARTLEENRIDCLGVAYLHEALELRSRGIKLPVVVLCGVRTREECGRLIESDITPVLFDLDAAEILSQEAARRGREVPFHLKVDTGMGRLGIRPEEVGEFVERIAGMKHLRLQALISHLSCAEEPESEFTDLQIKRFCGAVEAARNMGMDLLLNNLANSAGALCHRAAHFGMVRTGIVLYGGLPASDFQSPAEFRPVMHFKGIVLQVKELPDGAPVSYGRTYSAVGPVRIAVLSAGYGDGLPRAMSNKGYVLLHGRKVPIVGRICMNLTVTDVSALGNVKEGDEAVFLGSQGGEDILADQMAEWANTISYEIFCSLGRQAERKYVHRKDGMLE